MELLIVENNPEVSEVLTDYFTDQGYHVILVYSAEVALAAMEKCRVPFDAVITTNALPEMSGVDMATVIKRDYPQTPVVLISGTDLGPVPQQVDAFYVKPFDIEELGHGVKRLVEEHSSAQA